MKTHFEKTIMSAPTSRAALVDLDANTKLLVYDESIVMMLQRKRLPVPEEYQWPIVTALSRMPLKPVTRLWAGLKENALPAPIMLGFLRDGAKYVVERAFTRSDRAWRIISVLEQRARVNQIAILDKLKEVQALTEVLWAACQTEDETRAVDAIFAASSDAPPYEAARNMCGHAISARRALRVQDEGSIVAALSKRLQRLCERALEEHPQKDVLKRKI